MMDIAQHPVSKHGMKFCLLCNAALRDETAVVKCVDIEKTLVEGCSVYVLCASRAERLDVD
jgi:hypothetical protein